MLCDGSLYGLEALGIGSAEGLIGQAHPGAVRDTYPVITTRRLVMVGGRIHREVADR